jgi:hypothetical protein
MDSSALVRLGDKSDKDSWVVLNWLAKDKGESKLCNDVSLSDTKGGAESR